LWASGLGIAESSAQIEIRVLADDKGYFLEIRDSKKKCIDFCIHNFNFSPFNPRKQIRSKCPNTELSKPILHYFGLLGLPGTSPAGA